MSLRTLSSRSTLGNAIHTIECNTEATTKLVPEDVLKTMRDQVALGGKKAALWIRNCAQAEGELDIRFCVLKHPVVGELWVFHRLVCVPSAPKPGSDEWGMVQSFYRALYQEAEWAGVTVDQFTAYLKEEGLV